MKAIPRRFNLFLAITALAMLCGCQTENKNKEVSALRVHIEVNSSNNGTSQTVSVLRSDPVLVTIARDPAMTEATVIEAKVIDAHGGFAVQIQFDESSALMLEQYSAANPGKHFVIFGQWGEKLSNGRWLAAPLITHRIADGNLLFTPDMTRQEADRLVRGINNVAKKILKGQLK
jgi:transcriptional/translational regulatory protein YebC/TACO1